MLKAYTVWVQYTYSEEIDLNNTFYRRISFLFCIIHQLESTKWGSPISRAPAIRKRNINLSIWCKKTQQSVLRPPVQEYAVLHPTKYQNFNGWAYCVDGCIWVVTQTHKMHFVPLDELLNRHIRCGPINSIWLVNNHVELNTYWTVYESG